MTHGSEAQLACGNTLDIDPIKAIQFSNLVRFLTLRAIPCFPIEPVLCPLITAEIELIDLTIELILKGVQAKAAIEDIGSITAGQEVSPIAGSEFVIIKATMHHVTTTTSTDVVITVTSIKEVMRPVLSIGA